MFCCGLPLHGPLNLSLKLRHTVTADLVAVAWLYPGSSSARPVGVALLSKGPQMQRSILTEVVARRPGGHTYF